MDLKQIMLIGAGEVESEFIPLLSPEDEEQINSEETPSELPILPLRNTVLFPGVVIPITIGRDKSIKLIKKYFKGDYAFINEKLNVDIDFKGLQAILLANSLGLDEMEKVKRSNNKDYYLFSSYRKAKLKKMNKKSQKFDDDLVFSNYVDPENFRISKLGILDLRYNKSATVTYSDFSQEGDYMVAHEMDVLVQSAQPVKINAEYYRFTINEPLNFPFKISDKYEALD